MAMKRMTVVLGVALAGALMSASAQVRVSFTHLKSVDLSSYFPTGGQQGDLASDVAFDGANLYIAGMSNSAGSQPVGVLKVSNVLSLDAGAWGYSPLISLSQAGQRSTYVVYRDGFLYLGTGLGDNSNDPARTGIRKYDAQTGTQVSDWNGTGVVLPSNLNPDDPPTRAECIEIDPGYQGGEQSLAVLARGREYIFRRDFATGIRREKIRSLPSRDCQGEETTRGMRDITFSPEGDAYLRVDNSIFYAQRTGPDSVALERACQIFDFSSDNAFQVLINIHYLRTSAGDYLLYNRRGTPTSLNKIFVATGSGATWQDDYAQLTGDEPLPNGSRPTRLAAISSTSPAGSVLTRRKAMWT